MKENDVLSLRELFNKLNQQQTVYGEKMERLYDIFGGIKQFPSNVSNLNDSPGLWPDTGVNVYAILPEYTLAVKFCTTGVLFNIGQGRSKYQFMLVQSDELNPRKNGKLYYRYAKVGDNDWSKWMRFLYQYELTGGKDRDGNPILDDFGLPTTDTEDMSPESNPHNFDDFGKKWLSIFVDAAKEATKLAEARKIELTGLVQGSAMFDGSKDIQINTSAGQFYVPLNVNLTAGYRSNDEYHLLATLPASSGTTYDYVIVTGHIGGYEKTQGKCWFIACISNRSGAMCNGFYVGSLGTNDIVVYQTPLNDLEVYLKLRGHNDDCKISVYGSNQAEIKHEVKSLTVTNKVWNLQDCPHVFENNVYGTFRGNADTATMADNVKQIPMNSRSGLGYSGDLFAVGAKSESGNQVLITDKNIKFKSNGHIVASGFDGNLSGTATKSTTAESANNVKVKKNETTKCFLLGTSAADGSSYNAVNTMPYYDTNVYLTTTTGELYSKYFRNETAWTQTSNANVLNMTNKYSKNTSVSSSFNVDCTSSMYCLSDKQYFQTIRMGNGSNTASSVQARLYMERAQLVFGDKSTGHPQVIFNIADTSHSLGVYREGSVGGKQYVGVLNISGALNPTRVYHAIYNDVAELFPCKVKAEVGDVLMLDPNSDEELYVKSCEGAKCVAGVISDTYGCLLGGDPNMTPEELDKNFKPIGLAGRVKVNVVGKIEKGDKLVATDNGCARAYNPEKDSLDDVIGYAVIADDKTEKRQLKMKIK